jgi:DNA-binding NtrC family response regulator
LFQELQRDVIMGLLKDITLLYVEDDAVLRKVTLTLLSHLCGRVVTAVDGAEALTIFRERKVDLVLTDICMPNLDGLSLTKEIHVLSPTTPVVLATAFSEVSYLIDGIELGVAGFIQKPIDSAHLAATLERAALPVLQRRQLQGLAKELLLSVEHLLGKGAAFKGIAAQVCRVAHTDYPVLIQGETGTGKSRLARIIHDLSRRAGKPFVTVQLGSIPESLIAAELFGHEKGVFTGADRSREGLIAAANGGTLFLDDIDAAPQAVQPFLLRLVEEKEFCRLGSSSPVKADVRVITASNRDLVSDARAGLFRQDLYFRLASLLVDLPPLRAMREDIPRYAEQFMEEICEEMDREPLQFMPEVCERLKSHDWPGNIRELRNVVKRAVVMSDDLITAGIMSSVLRQENLAADSETHAAPQVPPASLPFTMAAAEKWAIERALTAAGGKKMVAARLLDMNYYTFRRHLVRHGFESEQPET